MNDKQKRARISATDLQSRDKQVRELQRDALAAVQGASESPDFKYRYKYRY